MAEQPTDKVLDHAYDGIQEYDNPLPGWWVKLFWITIVAAAVYVPYHQFGKGKGQIDEYNAEMRAAELAAPPKRVASGSDLRAAMANPGAIAAGKATYTRLCVACHRADGGGLVGPNLTDESWLHGGSMTDVVKVITDGVPAKGMLAWKTQLSGTEIIEVAAYVKSLKGTNPANPKAPQGQKYTGE